MNSKRKIIVGYVGHSNNLSHPADRRRFGVWAKANPGCIEVEKPLNSNLLILTNSANFEWWIKRANQPVILDLVDGYLGESPNWHIDFLRNIVRSLNHTSNIKWITYTRHLSYACKKSTAVIVASEEQAQFVRQLNKKVLIILDDHTEVGHEISLVKLNSGEDVKKKRILWEGFGYTLKHFEFMSAQLDEFLATSGWALSLVTNETFPRWGGYLGKVDSRSLVKKWFPKSYRSINLVEWSIESLCLEAAKSDLAIIPIHPGDKFAALKSENKLLSMWGLGLPTITSNTLSYSRVLHSVGLENAIIEPFEWLRALSELATSDAILAEYKRIGIVYVNKFHTHYQLLNAWEAAIKEFR